MGETIVQLSILTLPRNASYNERRCVFLSSREPGIAGQVTLVSRRDQAKDKYDTASYQVRFNGTHVIFAKLSVRGETVKLGEHYSYVAGVSPDGIPYSVWLRDGTRPAGCNCMAGQNDVPCKHRDIAKALLANDGPPDFGGER